MTDAKPDDATVSGDVTDSSHSTETEASTAENAAPESRPTPERRRLAPLVLVALTAALLAVAGTGFLWWQYRQFYVSLADADAATADALERVRASIRASADQLTVLETSMRAYDQSVREVENRLDLVPGQMADLERRIDAVQGGSFEARTSWLLAEAEYYLALANAELTLAANWETARAALRLADDRLREAADPGLASIRDLIADELIALEAVRLVDTEGLAFSLGRLAERADELPLRTQAPTRYSNGREGEAAEPGLGRLWGSVRNAFSSIISIERQSGDVAMAMSAEEARLARRQLALELQIARLALLRRQPETYQTSLSAARDLLEAEFNVEEAEVESALALIEELLMLEIAPALPDISRSLQALRARAGAQ